MYRELEERKVDLLISRRLVPIVEERTHSEILYEEPHVVVAGVGNPLASRRKIHPRRCDRRALDTAGAQ
jgi:DNA-binding transcriptional LysR family regulator